MKVRFFNPALGYKKIRKEMLGEIDRVLSAGDLILRGDMEEFEKKLATYVGTNYAVAVNSGTDALYLALWALGIKEGDEVLVPSHTFVATAQVVAQLGATPVLYDMDGTLTPTEKTKVIMPAHIAGEFSANMGILMGLATSKGIHVIEDACQALGATQDGKKAGSFGTAGAFSFYPAKILGAYGDAGALVTNDEKMYLEVKELRNHRKGDNAGWGINSRMDNVQAAILNVKFKYHTLALLKRAAIAEQYKALDGYVGLPNYTEGRVWQDYVIRCVGNPQKRDELFNFLKEKGIETMKNEYPFPIPKLPLSIAYEAETLRIPCNEHLTDREVEYVIEQIKSFYGARPV